MSIQERLQKIAEEKARIFREESDLRDEVMRELEKVISEIDALEERKEQLESFLGIDDTGGRLEHGKIRDICFGILSRYSGGLTAGQVRDIVERENPGMKVSSVPATLSRQLAQGRLRRDEFGKYQLA